ncbi:MAG: isochorismatase family protein [Deltaproteobacteria bacterium]|nr:isochorismatase family protein [Candidatus Anaeroferrophillus wilburensis]MBN2889148.1 isochorismatase family protein [Deltaproteobacteria bacterium]
MSNRSYCPIKDESALVIVDFQDAILNTFSSKVIKQLKKQTGLAIHMAQQLGIPIVVMEQYPQGLGATNEEIRALLGNDYQPFAKKVFSGWGSISTRLAELERKHLLIIGIEAHICVLQTAIDLLDQGYAVFVLRDAVGSRYTLDWQTGCELIEKAGGLMSTVQTVLFHFLGKAEGPDFKAMLPHLK